jgi:adenosylcobinamide-phosphate synthase
MDWGWILFVACLLDLAWGDPRWLPHPVVGMGKVISWLDRHLGRWIEKRGWTNETHREPLRWLGLCFPVVVVGGVWAVSWALVSLAYGWRPLAGQGLEVVMIWLAIAPRGLAEAGMNIYRALAAKNLALARQQLSMVVSRQTEDLDEAELVRGGVETVAENLVDAVVAPLFFAAIGGAPLAMAYRAVNTLDAMVGYRSDRYLHLGTASARLDDLCNFIPARLAIGLLLIVFLCMRLDVAQAWRAYRRDAHLHPSPNSGIPESLVAGALHIQLGGVNIYHGRRSERARLGDPLEPRQAKHLLLAVRVMWWATGLWVAILLGISVMGK